MNRKKLSLRGQEGPWKDNQGKSAVFVSLSRSGLGISETTENSQVTPTPMPSQDNCCSVWTPFLPGLPRCGFLHRGEDRHAPSRHERRGDAPDTPPSLGICTSPQKAAGTPALRPPLGPRPLPVSGAFFQGCWNNLQLHRTRAILPRNSGALSSGPEGFKAVQGSGGIATVSV